MMFLGMVICLVLVVLLVQFWMKDDEDEIKPPVFIERPKSQLLEKVIVSDITYPPYKTPPALRRIPVTKQPVEVRSLSSASIYQNRPLLKYPTESRYDDQEVAQAVDSVIASAADLFREVSEQRQVREEESSYSPSYESTPSYESSKDYSSQDKSEVPESSNSSSWDGDGGGFGGGGASSSWGSDDSSSSSSSSYSSDDSSSSSSYDSSSSDSSSSDSGSSDSGSSSD